MPCVSKNTLPTGLDNEVLLIVRAKTFLFASSAQWRYLEQTVLLSRLLLQKQLLSFSSRLLAFSFKIRVKPFGRQWPPARRVRMTKVLFVGVGDESFVKNKLHEYPVSTQSGNALCLFTPKKRDKSQHFE